MTAADRERYSRQIRFLPLGESGQERLLASTVGIVGCGALGSFAAGALARAGVGRLVLVDRDYVEVSNLQRQWLFTEADAQEAIPKAAAASREIGRINKDCVVLPMVADLTAANINELLGECDALLDGTDNFETRYLLNEFAVSMNKPWVYGAAVGSYGLTMTVVPQQTPCLVCVYPKAPSGVQPTCETAGVLGPVASIIASLECAALMKILAGAEASRHITTVDVWSGAVRQIEAPDRDPDCRVCGQHRFDVLDSKVRVPISLCGRDAVQIHERSRPLDLQTLGQMLSPLGLVRVNEFALRFFLEPYEMTIFSDGRAIIKGTTDIGVARGLYARYVGA